jgi:Secretion system C-terminal sorting domain
MVRIVKAILVLLVLGSLTTNSFSQDERVLSLTDQGWSFLEYAPKDAVIDMQHTGLATVPHTEGVSGDSALLISNYGITGYGSPIPQWINCVWKGKDLTNFYPMPDSVGINYNIQSYTPASSRTLAIRFLLTYKDPASGSDGQIFMDQVLQKNIGVWQRTAREVFNWGDSLKIKSLSLSLGVLLDDSAPINISLVVKVDNYSFYYYKDKGWIVVDSFEGSTVGIIDQLPTIPTGFKLYQNYPNPFNPTTRIRYEIPEPGNVNLSVYNILGQKVAELVNQFQSAGVYEAAFDASHLASSAYIYILRTQNFSIKKKMLLLR